MRTLQQTTQTTKIDGVASIEWITGGKTLKALDTKGNILKLVSANGVIQQTNVIAQQNESALVTRLANAANITFTSYQAIPDDGWLLIGPGTATILQRDGTTTTASRWFSPILAVAELGNNVLVTIRADGVSARNLTNNQTQNFDMQDVVQASGDQSLGIMNLLVQDGDLLQWIKGRLF